MPILRPSQNWLLQCNYESVNLVSQITKTNKSNAKPVFYFQKPFFKYCPLIAVYFFLKLHFSVQFLIWKLTDNSNSRYAHAELRLSDCNTKIFVPKTKRPRWMPTPAYNKQLVWSHRFFHDNRVCHSQR